MPLLWLTKDMVGKTLLQYFMHYIQARSQDLEKGGGYFERLRSVQTTLTRIFIDLKSVSDGLSKFETKCLEKIENSTVFSAKT